MIRCLKNTAFTPSHIFVKALRLAGVVTLFSLASFGQYVTATIPVGTTPISAAVNPVTNKIYVVNARTNDVTVIDGATNATVTVPVGPLTGFSSTACDVAVNPVANKIYVLNPDANSLTIIDGLTNATATVALTGHAFCVATDAALNQIYVVTFTASSQEVLTVIDGATNTPTAVPLDIAAGTSGLAVDPLNHLVYVSDDDTDGDIGHLVTVNGVSKSITQTVAVGILPLSVVVNPASNLVYAGNSDGSVCCSGPVTVSLVDANSGLVLNTISLAAACCFDTVNAVNPVTNKIYAFDRNGLEEIDGATNAVRLISATPGTDLTVDPGTNRVFRVNTFTNSLDIIDPVNGATTAVPVANTVNLVVVNPVTHKAYALNPNSNTVTVVDTATNLPANVSADPGPAAAGVNAVTGKAYIANSNGDSVTVIDGANNNATLDIPVGTTPVAVGVNQATNKIYAANKGSNDVTVIDGATNATAPVAAGTNPVAVGVNSATNQIYVANKGSNNVTVIDGASNATSSVAVGTTPVAVAANPANNKIYVANQGSNNVTIIDGATNTTTTVAAGNSPFAVAVNPSTNNAYVANGDNNVIVINGTGNVAATVAVGTGPVSVAVDTLTNKIYVANQAGNSVTVIDGATNVTTTVPAGSAPLAVTVNPASNKIYVVDGSNNATVIDGATNTTSTVAVGSGPVALAADSVANKVYVANALSGDVTVLTEQQVQPVPLTTTITPTSFTGVISPISNPSFSFTVQDAFQPAGVPPQDQVYFQVDGQQGPWALATGSGSSFTVQLPSLATGDHVLFAWAGDGQEATAIAQAETVIGLIGGYPFTIVATGQTRPLIITPVNNTATVMAGNSATYTLNVSAQGTLSSAVTFARSGLPALATCSFNPSSVNASGTPTPVTLTISTTVPSSAATPGLSSWAPLSGAGLLLPAVVFCGGFWKRRRLSGNCLRCMASIAVATLLLLSVGCGASPHTPSGGTPTGSFNITVTSTAGSVQTTTALTLNVQ
jgi:YVTN family beta-propeller protein